MDIVSHIVKFNSQTNGRDKLCRFLQYTSKLVWSYGDSTPNSIFNKSTILKIKDIETSFSSTRKVLRLGKSLDLIQGALKSLDVNDHIVKLALVAGKLNQACYLLIDHYVWFSKITKADGNTKYWMKIAARFWLVTLTFNLIRNIYDIVNIYCRNARKRAELSGRKSNSERRSRISEFIKCVTANKLVVVDTVKNTCDIFLPLSNIGYIQISTTTQGMLGMISSMMGMLQTWNPECKLVPS